MHRIALILLVPLMLSAQTLPAGGRGGRGAGLGGTPMPPPPPPTPVGDLATLQGQAVNAITGTPLRKVNVVINRQGRGPMAPGSRGTYSATTDASGNFSIARIEPGTYRVTASHTGYLSTTYNARRPGGSGTPLELGRAQRMSGVVLKLTPHGVITGKVVDEDGDPLQNVTVEALRVVYNGGRKQLQNSDSDSTNDLGEFRIAGVEPAKYYLCAVYRNRRAMVLLDGEGDVDDNTLQEDYAATYFPGVTDFAAAAPIPVGPGDQVQGVNLRLTKIHTVKVSGRVVNNEAPSSTPPGDLAAGRGTITVAGRAIQLSGLVNSRIMIRMVPRGMTNPNSVNLNGVVKADGTFEFPSVPPGSYTLIASSNRAARGRTARQSIEVGSNNVDGINLAINPGSVVTGHVKFDGSAPDPMPSLSVRLTPRDPTPGTGGQNVTKVDADGSFRLEDVNPDVYNVFVNTPEGYYLKAAGAGSTDVLTTGLDLSNGAATVEIMMGANPPQVSGTVMDASTQQPAAAVTVVLIPREKERQGESYFYSTAITDQNGNFHFTRVMPGEFDAYAWEDASRGEWYDPEFLKTYDGKGERVTAKEGSPATLKLTMIPAK